jgi:DNA-binding response OmpR family regulator
VPHVLVATDAKSVRDEVVAALSGPDTSLSVVRSGGDVLPLVRERRPDLVVLDLQIGNMGAMAVTMELRLEASAGRAPHVPVLMLLDRRADVFLALRSHAEGWLIKPLEPFRLKRAALAVMAGRTVREGLPDDHPTDAPGMLGNLSRISSGAQKG